MFWNSDFALNYLALWIRWVRYVWHLLKACHSCERLHGCRW